MPPPAPTRNAHEFGRPDAAWGLGVGLLALVVFARGVRSEPHFADESAYISQSFYVDLFFSGSWNDPRWLQLPALDLPPLAKYLVGAALRIGGYRSPGLREALLWYQDIDRRFESDAMLICARWPMPVLGAIGCVAIFALGTMAGGRRVGTLAALLLMADPLYRLSARRAMADVPAEALILATTAVALGSWRALLAGTSGLVWAILAGVAVGVLGGLATLAKLNGALGLMVVAAWLPLTWALPRIPVAGKTAVTLMTIIAGVVAFGTFVLLNPFETARPARSLPGPMEAIARLGIVGRTRLIVAHRRAMVRGQQEHPLFRGPYALLTPGAKVAAVAVQGFGRFGDLGPPRHDSRIPYPRYSWTRDAGALIWIPWVLAGAGWAWLRGRAQLRAGTPPTAWAVLIQAAVALAVVTTMIPLAWDRYYLSIQPGSALLAAGVAVAVGEGLARRIRRG